jgi:DNA-binding response OmpR family regulator
MKPRLFIVAGPPLAGSLVEQFEALGGYDAEIVASPNELPAPWPDAVLLDAAVCDVSRGARRLRRQGFAGRIVALAQAPSAKAARDPRRGIDAVLARPFRFADLLACLDAPRESPQLAAFGARLTEKEAAILERLTRADGAVIAKSTLLAEVWGYGPTVSTRTLETHIHRLRRKIEADPARPRRLLTESGGYRLARINQDETEKLTTP